MTPDSERANPLLVGIEKDLLWGMYKELRDHSRHIETSRAMAINFSLLVGAALVTVITSDRVVASNDTSLTILLALIGLIAATFSVSYAERYRRGKRRANAVRREIDQRFLSSPGPGLSELEATADNDPDKLLVLRWAKKFADTHYFWLLLPLVLLGLGIVLTIVAVTAATAPPAP